MYLFRQFCGFSWLAIFFKKSIVSRGSVNGTCQKGPRLAQSFSTKVAIESGLYIAPGYARFLVRTAIRTGSCQIGRSAQDLPIWDLPDGCPERPPDRPGPTGGSDQVRPEICSGQRNPGNPEKSRKSQKSPKSRLLAKSRLFGEIYDFPEISRFRTSAVHACYMASTFTCSCAHCCQEHRPTSCAHMLDACSTHWHNVHRVEWQTRTLHQSCHLLHVLINRALWK